MAKRNNFVQTIKTIAQSLVNNAGYDKTRTGQIVGINEATMTYSVRVDGQTYNNVKAMDGNQYNLRDIVKVVIPCNQASQIYISSAAYSDNTLGNRVAYAQSVADEAMTFIEEELPEELQSLRDDLEEQIDGKIETWAQDSNPATAWTTAEVKAQHDSDLWLYTGLIDLTVGTVTIKPQAIYQYDGTNNTWNSYSSTSRNIFDLADGKTTIFYGTTSGTYANKQVGDYLVDNTDGCTYRWTGAEWFKLTDYKSYTDISLQNLRTDLESQIDAQIETWAQNSNPATSWATSTLKAEHDGDLWYFIGLSDITVDGVTIHPSKTYQYQYNSSTETGTWVQYNSPSRTLFDLADGKTTIFYGSTSGTYANVEANDYLVDSTTGCTYQYNGSGWIKVTDYQTDIATAVGALEADLEAQIDAKIETWTQTEDPSSAWTTTELKNQHNGDLWFYIGTTNSTVNDSAGNPVAPSKTYQYNSSTNKWVLYNSPNKSLFDLADGKSTIFYGTPSSFSSVADVGDVCINPNDHNKAYRWDGSSWNFVGGGDPINTATITLYQRASSAPSAPSGGQTYTFETGVLNPIPSGWSRDIPSGSNPCYITQTNVTSVNASVTISSWSTPVMFVQDGIDAPTAVVSITVDTISYLNNTATLRATLFVDGAVKTPIIYAWTKGTSTTVVGTNVTLGITDLDAVYNCVVTWSD